MKGFVKLRFSSRIIVISRSNLTRLDAKVDVLVRRCARITQTFSEWVSNTIDDVGPGLVISGALMSVPLIFLKTPGVIRMIYWRDFRRYCRPRETRKKEQNKTGDYAYKFVHLLSGNFSGKT